MPSISNAAEETQLRRLIEEQAQAVRDKNVEGSMANYTSDIVSFDVVNPLQKVGMEACRERIEGWFASFQGPIGFEQSDLNLTVGDDVAFCHSLNQVRGTKVTGGQLEMWWRATMCWRKIDGQWKITHEHGSVPFDTSTGKASLNLQP